MNSCCRILFRKKKNSKNSSRFAFGRVFYRVLRHYKNKTDGRTTSRYHGWTLNDRPHASVRYPRCSPHDEVTFRTALVWFDIIYLIRIQWWMSEKICIHQLLTIRFDSRWPRRPYRRNTTVVPAINGGCAAHVVPHLYARAMDKPRCTKSRHKCTILLFLFSVQ